MSLSATCAAWEARISPGQKLVLLAITECSGGDGFHEWWRRDDVKIGKLTSLDPERIDYAVHQLMRRGALIEGSPPIEHDESDEWFEVIPWKLPGVKSKPLGAGGRPHGTRRESPKPDISGYVYVISGGGYSKIGRAKDPDARFKGIGAKMPFELRRLVLIRSEDYVALEQELHEKFASKRSGGEWFSLSPEDIEQIRSEHGSIE